MSWLVPDGNGQVPHREYKAQPTRKSGDFRVAKPIDSFLVGPVLSGAVEYRSIAQMPRGTAARLKQSDAIPIKGMGFRGGKSVSENVPFLGPFSFASPKSVGSGRGSPKYSSHKSKCHKPVRTQVFATPQAAPGEGPWVSQTPPGFGHSLTVLHESVRHTDGTWSQHGIGRRRCDSDTDFGNRSSVPLYVCPRSHSSTRKPSPPSTTSGRPRAGAVSAAARHLRTSCT